MPQNIAAHMNLLSFGAGAIGTYIGGSLALSGCQVVFLERPEIVQTLRKGGLTLEIEGEIRKLPQPDLTASLPEALAKGPFDAALFALKSFDTSAALEQMQPYADQLPPMICLQNGVDNEAAIEKVLGKDRVIAATITSAIGRRGPGSIVLERLRGAGLVGDHPISPALFSAFNQAGLNARLYARSGEMKWSKMLTNMLANASSAILDFTPEQVFANPGLFRLEIAQLREALAVMRALGYRVVDLPGTPVRALAFGAQYLPLSIGRPLMARAVGGGRGNKMPSFHIDLHSGRGRSEVEYLNGAVVRHGASLGIDTPANRLLNNTLLSLTERAVSLETYRHQPERLLQDFHLKT
jgi:2-dehydropantoate 2-reductase